MWKLVDRLTRKLLRDGLRRGLLQGSDLWLALGAVALVVRVIAKPEPPKVVSQKLALGESVTITHLPPPLAGRAKRKVERAAAES